MGFLLPYILSKTFIFGTIITVLTVVGSVYCKRKMNESEMKKNVIEQIKLRKETAQNKSDVFIENQKKQELENEKSVEILKGRKDLTPAQAEGVKYYDAKKSYLKQNEETEESAKSSEKRKNYLKKRGKEIKVLQ